MSEQTQTDMQQFYQFLTEQVNDGDGDMTPEQDVDLWRLQNPSPGGQEAIHSSIRRALDDMRVGRGIPLDQFVEDFRQRNQIPTEACRI